MKSFGILLRREPTFVEEDVNADEFDMVAIVLASGLDEVWSIAQNDYISWKDKKNVVLLKPVDGLRSLSVGDIVFDAEAAWMVTSVGFNKMQLIDRRYEREVEL